MIEHLLAHRAGLFYAIAGILLLTEVSVLGLSGPLIIIGLGFAVTGMLIGLDMLTTLSSQLLTVAVLSALLALLLWKPLKKLTAQRQERVDTSSDMIGIEVLSSENITKIAGKVKYSGISWEARLHKSSTLNAIEADKTVAIKEISGTTLYVIPIE